MDNNNQNSYFQKALGNMTREVAYGAAVRHLVDAGCSVREICERLTYPAPYEAVQRMVYDYMITSGILLTEEPREDCEQEQVEFVLEESPYGKKSYRRVVTKTERTAAEYVPCDFGLLDAATFGRICSALHSKDRDYITGIPWPKKCVYHLATPRMREIAERVSQVLEVSDDTETD